VDRRLLGTALLALSTSSSALPLGTADGSLTVADKAVRLTHAYAWQRQSPFPPKEARTLVLVSDREVPPSALGRTLDLYELARRGELFGFEAEIRPTGEIATGVILSSAFPSGFLSVSGMDHFVATNAGPGRIAGKISMAEPSSWGPPNTKGITFAYTATFEAEVKP
jgi:hypothetical protein